MKSRMGPAAGMLSALGFVFLFILTGWTNELPSSLPSASEEILRHVRYLASDELMGRGVGTPGLDLARDYIAREFKSTGLLPGGDSGSYFQRLEVVSGVEVREPSAARLDKNSELALNTDWIPLGLSASGAAEGEIVFAGYGITAKEHGYDDYAAVDVKGKIVLVLRYEPPPKDEKSPFRKAPRYSSHATFQSKLANARNHGAAAMILVDLGPRKPDQKELIPTRRSLARNEAGLIAVQFAGEIVEKRLQREGLSLRDLKEKIDREEKPASTDLPAVRASLQVKMEKITKPADNVVAILPGSDPKLKEENVVVGAHYDHLGLGIGASDPAAEGQIHRGADDNASGTAVLMSVAAKLARRADRPPRTIVFVAFTGEELGLYGSRYFVDHPPFSIGSIRAMINLDMVGRMQGNHVIVNSADTAKEFRDIVSRAAAGLEVEFGPARGGSDQASFTNKGIPALHIYTGTHPDYHQPTDSWEKLNVEGMSQISDMALSLVREIAGAKTGLTFVKPAPSRRGSPASSPSQNP